MGTYDTARADTAALVDMEKRHCRAGDSPKRPCFHPFRLQSAFSVQGGGLDPRALTETGLCQPAPSASSNFSLAHSDSFTLRPELLLDLIWGRPMCVQFSSA